MRFKVRREPTGRLQVRPPPQVRPAGSDRSLSERATQCFWGPRRLLGFRQWTQQLLPGRRLRQARSVARKAWVAGPWQSCGPAGAYRAGALPALHGERRW